MFRLHKTTLAVSRLRTISLVKALATQPGIQSTSRVSFNPISATDLKQRDLNPLAGRKYLAGSSSQAFPKYLANPREDFPHALQLETADNATFKELGKLSRDKLDANLLRSGAVLFRSTGIQSPQDFKEFVKGIGYKMLNYEGGAGNRSAVDSQIFSSTDDPPEHNIELHTEMSGTPYYAKKVIFCCLQPPKPNCGGLTPIAKTSDILASLDPEVVGIFKKRKVRYLRYLPDAKDNPYISWQQTFVTEDKKVAEEFLKKAGVNFEWIESTCLCLWHVLDPIVPHVVTGQPVWFNQIDSHHNTCLKESPMYEGLDLPDHMYSFHTQFGDGQEIDSEILDHLRSVDWSEAVGFDWMKGDVLVMDNMTVAHSRLSFSGPRKIIVSLHN